MDIRTAPAPPPGLPPEAPAMDLEKAETPCPSSPSLLAPLDSPSRGNDVGSDPAPSWSLTDPEGPLTPSPKEVERTEAQDPAHRLVRGLSKMELDEELRGGSPEEKEIQGLMSQLQALRPDLVDAPPREGLPCPLHIAMGRGLATPPPSETPGGHGLLSVEAGREDLLSLLCCEGSTPTGDSSPPAQLSDMVSLSDPVPRLLQPPAGPEGPEAGGGDLQKWSKGEDSPSSSPEPWLGPNPLAQPEELPGAAAQAPETLTSFPAFREVPGPCDPEDLLDGVIFGAKYMGSTQLVSERNPPTSARMAQAQEAVDRIKAPEGESQPMTEVDLFISTQRVKVLTADSQEAMMDHPLQTISYIADIGNIVVLMARRCLAQRSGPRDKRLYKMICHVFHSADAQLIAQAIGQAFSVAYQHFLQASGIDPCQLSAQQYQEALGDGDLHNGDLAHFSNQENCKDVTIQKQKGEILGVAVVESGWGSLLPTVVIANLLHGGPAERSGELSIGDRLTAVNGTSLVGLPLAACQNIIRELKHQVEVKLNIVHCPPVTTAIIRRPDAKDQLGFCVENGIICSLMRGGIAERGGIRVGHRIIEINGQSVVAMPHEKIIQLLTQAVSEVHIKTMPASTYRLLTGQEQPLYL
ncbi:amyloid-beta A4 precursor protein-binding family A member 3 [Ornithorhynchus anatinus]|uniref:Amyloid-beta A4 precursor protein-binding family A member 3 n=1 Tax=Ornithorhynchus anatinus TaxID=9258 RepID=F6US59_ORNAN|nr:amyloid-beta A4 precursor protein-binding family A member 3 [Ornithorhynchus anatinus]XP_028909057.1 amyloid-beta A4 precursor protein-binding family A member 3 [Ornithorhynchus anatinus]